MRASEVVRCLQVAAGCIIPGRLEYGNRPWDLGELGPAVSRAPALQDRRFSSRQALATSHSHVPTYRSSCYQTALHPPVFDMSVHPCACISISLQPY